MTVTAAPQPEIRKTPFWRTLWESVLFVLSNLPALVKIGWAPFIIIAVTSLLAAAQAYAYDPYPLVLTLPAQIVGLFGYAAFAVAWHRYVILGDTRNTPAEWFAPRTLVFFVYLLLFGGGLAVLIGAFGAIAAPGTIQPGEETWYMVSGLVVFLCAIAIFVLVRFYLVFPARAIDRPLSFGEAWRRMRGNTWRLLWATILICLAPSVLVAPFSWGETEAMEQIIAARARGEPIDVAMPAYLYLMPILGFVTTAMAVTMLTRIYLHVMGPPDRGPTERIDPPSA